MRSWTRLERRWRDALLGALIPGAAPGALPSLAQLDTTAFWDEVGGAAPPLLRFGLRVSVWGLTLAPLVMGGRRRLFPGLERAEQDAVLRRAAGSRSFLVRQLVVTLKAMACFAYFREERARAPFEPNDDPATGGARGSR